MIDAMQILSFDHVAIPADLDASANTLLTEAYGADDEPEDTQDDGAPPSEAYRAFLAVDPVAGVVGHLAAYIRRVDQGGTSMDIGMIGDVATLKTFQRRGVATALVEATHHYFKDAHLPFSMLFAYVPSVYASSGYRLMTDEVTFVDGNGTTQTRILDGSMVCDLSSRLWRAGVVNLNGRAV